MKKHIALIFAYFCSILLLHPSAKANNAAAGEISYEWVSDSTYRFYFRFYSDCSGNAEPATVPLCFHNPCNPAQSFSITLSKTTTTGTVMPVGCYRGKTRCDSAGSTLAGYKEWIYSELATLPTRCNAWHIFTYVANRNASVNIQNPTTKPYYAEARFNNTGTFRTNSSPFCTAKPVIYGESYGKFTYNNRAVDPDGDSLVTEVINPLTGVNNCVDTIPSNVSYKSVTPAIGIPINPFQTSNTFNLIQASGDIFFFALDTARNTAAFRISEYRNGILIGSVTREIQAQVLQASYPSVHISLPGGIAPTFIGDIRGCPNVLLNFSLRATSNDPNSNLWITDDFATSMPGSTVIYTNQGTDSVFGTVSWTPTINDRGPVNILTTVVDSFCTRSGYYLHYRQGGLIEVADTLRTIHDTTICLGEEISWQPYGGDYYYSWQELPNGNPGSIDCFYPDCRNVTVRPNMSTTYVVTSGLSCPPAVTDTIMVNVNTNRTHPYITMTMDPATGITPATKVLFTATAFNCANPTYKWYLNNQELQGITGTTYSRLGLGYGDKVYCRLICKDSCPIPRDTFSNDGLVDETIIGKLHNSSAVSIYPNPNNGSFILTAKINTNTCDAEILNTLGQVKYKQTFPIANGLLKEQINLELPPGVYLLKCNSELQRFIVNDH